MRNTLDISISGEDLLACLNDGTNRLLINGVLINPSEYIGTGTYTDTIEGHSISISKIASDTGNIQMIKTADYTYRLLRVD